MIQDFFLKRLAFSQKTWEEYAKGMSSDAIDGRRLRWSYAPCMRCKFMDFDTESCAAFPDGIPEDIVYGDIQHHDVVQGQNGTYTFTDVGPEPEVYPKFESHYCRLSRCVSAKFEKK